MALDNLISPMVSRKKDKIINDNIKSYLEEKDYKDELKKQERAINESLDIEKANQSINESYEKRLNDSNKQRVKNDIAINETIGMTIPVLFSSLVYRSLPLDEDFKKQNVKYIYESATKLFEVLYSSGAIQIKEDSAFNLMCEEIAVAFSSCENDNDITLPKVVNTALWSNPTLTDTITSCVEKKVTKAVSDEQENIKVKNERLKEEKFVKEDKSLFRYLNEANIHEIIKENKDLSKKEVMDLALSESILDYTLLETLHTCKLVDFDFTKINTVKRFLAK